MSVPAEIPDVKPDATSRVIRESNRDLWLRRLKVLAPVWTLLVMWVFFSLTSSSFATTVNFNNILSQVATAGILAVGMTFVLLTGEIDLSIAAVMGLSAYVAVYLYVTYQLPEPIPVIIGLLVGTLCGAASGIISTLMRVPTFMSTLAMSLIAEGLLLWISQGRQLFTESLSPLIQWVGSAKIGSDPGVRQGVLIVLTAVCLLIGFLVLRYTRFGRYVYMTGANSSAARLAGVNTKFMVFCVLCISGFTSAVAGIAAVGRLGTAIPSPQPNYLIQAIAVVVLGGTSLTGGRGGMWQTTVGLLIYGSLTNGLDNVANINTFQKTFITGLVLLAALIVNILFSGRASRDKTV